MASLKTLAERLIAAREALGYSQKEAAVKAGISQPSLWSLENGETKTTKHIVKLARALKQSAEWLESGEGEMGSRPEFRQESKCRSIGEASMGEAVAGGAQRNHAEGSRFAPVPVNATA